MQFRDLIQANWRCYNPRWFKHVSTGFQRAMAVEILDLQGKNLGLDQLPEFPRFPEIGLPPVLIHYIDAIGFPL